MAVPARVSAAAQGPAHSRRKSDPMSPGWADVQQGLTIAARACALAVTELARRPDDDAALEMARLCLAAQEKWGEIARRWVLDEAVLAAERQRAYDEGVAAEQARRRCLEVVRDA